MDVTVTLKGRIPISTTQESVEDPIVAPYEEPKCMHVQTFISDFRLQSINN